VASRWIRTRDHSATFTPPFDEDDWLLLTGKFIIGRVVRDRSGPQSGRVGWSLTGPHGAPINTHGMTDTLEQAQAELLAAWRVWQMWAEVRDLDSGPPRGDATEDGEP
jgi:hypothetical protein